MREVLLLHFLTILPMTEIAIANVPARYVGQKMYEYITSQSNIVQLSIEILYMPKMNGSTKGRMPVIKMMFRMSDFFTIIILFCRTMISGNNDLSALQNEPDLIEIPLGEILLADVEVKITDVAEHQLVVILLD